MSQTATATVETLLNAAKALSDVDRRRLAQGIWDSILDDASLSIPPELRVQLDGRLAELRANPGSAVTWEEIKARLRQMP
jgi:putative addiction module component (TIGR02574 family)